MAAQACAQVLKPMQSLCAGMLNTIGMSQAVAQAAAGCPIVQANNPFGQPPPPPANNPFGQPPPPPAEEGGHGEGREGMRCEGGERQERRERRGRKDPLSRLTPEEKVGTSFYPLIVTTNAQPITQVFLGSTVPDGGRGREGEEGEANHF